MENEITHKNIYRKRKIKKEFMNENNNRPAFKKSLKRKKIKRKNATRLFMTHEVPSLIGVDDTKQAYNMGL